MFVIKMVVLTTLEKSEPPAFKISPIFVNACLVSASMPPSTISMVSGTNATQPHV